MAARILVRRQLARLKAAERLGDGDRHVDHPAELVGCAPNHSVVAVTLVRLRELAGATDVQLNAITRPLPTADSGNGAAGATSSSDCGKMHSVDAVKWDATVSFDPKATSTATNVPRSLGGGA